MKNIFYSVMLLVFISTESSFATSNEKLMSSCNNDDKVSCYTLGLRHLESTDTDKYVKGTILLNHACNMNYSSACVVLAWVFYDGKKVMKDYHQADHYFWTACKLKDAGGCQGLADMHDNGHGVEKDNKKALMYHKLSCEYGSPNNCYMAGQKYEKSNAKEKDICGAVYYYYKSCTSAIPQGCEELERLKVHKECFEE